MTHDATTAPAPSWWVLGGGFTGRAVSRALAQRGAEVHLTSTTEEGAHTLRAQGWDAHTWRAGSALAPHRAARALITFGPSQASLSELRAAIDACAERGARRVYYLSSTAVYGPAGGAWIDDAARVAPETALGEARAEAERAYQEECVRAGVDGCALRLAGIYGPGRSGRARFLAGTYRVPAGGPRYSNRISARDAASALLKLDDAATRPDACIVADGSPFTIRGYADWMCAQLALPPLPDTPWSEVPARSRPFFAGNRRCRPSTLTALGWSPAFASVFEGLPLCWREEDSAAAG